jgi:phage gp29-like protein
MIMEGFSCVTVKRQLADHVCLVVEIRHNAGDWWYTYMYKDLEIM